MKISAIYDPPNDLATLFGAAMLRKLPAFRIGRDELISLNIGAGFKEIAGAIPLELPGWNAEIDPIPYADRSVGVIHAYGVLDHIKNITFVLQEFQRVLAPGGVVNISVAYYTSNLAHRDLDHKSFFAERSWEVLFNNEHWNNTDIEWKFDIGINLIMGDEEQNLSLITQLIRVG